MRRTSYNHNFLETQTNALLEHSFYSSLSPFSDVRQHLYIAGKEDLKQLHRTASLLAVILILLGVGVFALTQKQIAS